MVRLVVIPQRGYHLCRCHIVRVGRKHSQAEDSVMPEILVGEARDVPAVQLVLLHSLGQLDVLLDVADSTDGEDGPQPGEEAVDVGKEDEDDPEPKKYKKLLREEINRQSALDCVILYVRELAYLKVTHGDAWKYFAMLADIVSPEHELYDVNAEGREVNSQPLGPEQVVEQVELANRIT